MINVTNNSLQNCMTNYCEIDPKLTQNNFIYLRYYQSIKFLIFLQKDYHCNDNANSYLVQCDQYVLSILV